MRNKASTKASVFNKARNIDIKDSSLAVNVNVPKHSTLDRLLNEVARNAILNAGGRADEVRCYPGTREEVIEKLERWMGGNSSGGSRMMWLSGPAGAGKSAIFQTIAERCRERGLHAVNFFFFRGDGTRNRARPLVATLVYQLRRLYPALDEPVAECLAADPLICSASIEEQFIQLVSSPIQTINRSLSNHRPIMLIIDGLDECDDKKEQEHILLALRALTDVEHSPFFILVASRAEPHLVMSFNKLGTSVESIFLDGKYRPQDDIRRFVAAKFKEIKRDHHLAHMLRKNWPPEADIDAITAKSSGQFIYAATVMRFIQYSSESPALNLLRVHGMRPPANHSPHAQLDAVYSYIFSQAQDIHAVKLILGAYFITANFLDIFQHLLRLIGYEMMEIKSFFADLSAIIQVVTGSRIELVFYHASLSDYLQDKSRSGMYHVDVGAVATELTLICLRNFNDQDSFEFAIFALDSVEEATPELSQSLLDASIRQVNDHAKRGTLWLSEIMKLIEKLYSFKRDKALFKVILRSWVRFSYLNNIDLREVVVPKSISTSWHYKWYCATQGAKFALRLNR